MHSTQVRSEFESVVVRYGTSCRNKRAECERLFTLSQARHLHVLTQLDCSEPSTVAVTVTVSPACDILSGSHTGRKRQYNGNADE